MNTLDKAVFRFGLANGFFALRWVCNLDPKIALVSQVVFSLLPTFAQPLALSLCSACQWINVTSTGVMNMSLYLTGNLMNVSIGSLSHVYSLEAIGGVWLLVAALSVVFLFPAMLVVPFVGAKGSSAMVIASINIALSMGYFGYKYMESRRPPRMPPAPNLSHQLARGG